jgi:hypothetical protein
MLAYGVYRKDAVVAPLSGGCGLCNARCDVCHAIFATILHTYSHAIGRQFYISTAPCRRPTRMTLWSLCKPAPQHLPASLRRT